MSKKWLNLLSGCLLFIVSSQGSILQLTGHQCHQKLSISELVTSWGLLICLTTKDNPNTTFVFKYVDREIIWIWYTSLHPH